MSETKIDRAFKEIESGLRKELDEPETSTVDGILKADKFSSRREEIEAKVEELARFLEGKGIVLTTAESCTGGLVAAALTAYPGASEWFDRGFVTYTNESKHEMLGVPEDIFPQFGAVSEECVSEMLKGALAHSKAKISTAISGIAGPTGAVPGKPVGTVYIGWMAGDDIEVKRFQFDGDRTAVREQATIASLEGFLRFARKLTK